MKYKTIEVRWIKDVLTLEGQYYGVRALLKDKSQTALFNDIKNVLFKSMHKNNPGGKYWLCINCKHIDKYIVFDNMRRRVRMEMRCEKVVMSHTKLSDKEIIKKLI